MSIEVDIQVALEELGEASSYNVPPVDEMQRWVLKTLEGKREEAQLTVRVVGINEGVRLNETYRRKQGPTNVLSFPFAGPEHVMLPLLGDVVICAPVVAQEAVQQGKPLVARWCHMVVHGVLHLLGYDHIEKRDAEVMEGEEITLLRALGYANPYDERDGDWIEPGRGVG